jgi:hypothetical protein
MSDLPRPDLREPAFRKYESDIARACKGTIKISRELLLAMGIKPATYVCRFRDAILGYKRYSYQSAMIPSGFDFSNLRLAETTDGGVNIYNALAKIEESVFPTDVPIALSSSLFQELILALRSGKAHGQYKIKYENEDEFSTLSQFEVDDIILIKDAGRETGIAVVKGWV